MKQKIVADISIQFALRIVKLYKFLCDIKREYILSKQLLRSGTSIGALVRESEHAESKTVFIHKLSISLKEANETDYWLFILRESEFLTQSEYSSLQKDCQELLKLLVRIIKTSKSNLNNAKK